MRGLTALFMVSAFFAFAALSSPSALFASGAEKIVNVLIIGDSLSAGFGVRNDQSYPFLMQKMLEEDGLANVRIINGSISGSTTSGAYSRLKWHLRSKPSILILALGANDGLRGLSPDMMTENLEKTILLARENGILVILAGMKLPPNYGKEYARAFEESFTLLARKYELPFIPFLLKDVAGRASLNQADGIHPNPEGYKIIAVTVLKKLMEQL